MPPQPQYWYHISPSVKGSRATLNPRDNDESENRERGEPNIPRICVSPSLDKCLLAVPVISGRVYYIYRTAKKAKARRPFQQNKKETLPFDRRFTDEHWLLQDTDFVRVGRVMSAVSVGANSYDSGNAEDIPLSAIEKNLKYIRSKINSGEVEIKLSKKYAAQKAGMTEWFRKKRLTPKFRFDIVPT